MKGGRRYGFRFLSHTQAWQAQRYKKAYTQVKKATPSQTKTVMYNSPFGRLILGKCGGCK